MIFQEPMASLNPCFTVGFQIEEVLRVHLGLDRKAAPRARHRAAAAGRHSRRRSERLGTFPHQMSGGQCQRVMIAMAIACNPKLLIADEPTTALDVTIQEQILDLLARLQEEHGMALILITHDMGVVAETAERVHVQYAGQKVEEQPVTDAVPRPASSLHRGAAVGAARARQVGQRLPSIAGVVPGQHDRPTGCLFAPRCSFATPECDRGVKRQGAELGLALCNYPLKSGKPLGHPGLAVAASAGGLA